MRSAVVIGPRGDGWAAYFGDQGANVHAIDALTGKSLWTATVDHHPSAQIAEPADAGRDDALRARLVQIGSRVPPTRLTAVAPSEAASSLWTPLRER